jgi:hypothetical protein
MDSLGSVPEDPLKQLLDYIVSCAPDIDPGLLHELLDQIQAGENPIEVKDRSAVTQEELVELARGLWPVHETADIRTSSENRALIPIATAWWHATFRHAEATCRLVQGGLPDVAVPNARSAFEHGVYLSALAQCADDECLQDFLDTAEAEFLRVQRAMIKDLEKDERFDRPEGQLIKHLVDGLPVLLPPAGFGWILNFEQVCKRLRGGYQLLYPSYRLMSGMTHAGFASAGVYFWSLTSDAPMRPVARYGETLFTAVASAVWASQAFDHLLGTETASALSEIADRLNIKPLFRAE